MRLKKRLEIYKRYFILSWSVGEKKNIRKEMELFLNRWDKIKPITAFDKLHTEQNWLWHRFSFLCYISWFIVCEFDPHRVPHTFDLGPQLSLEDNN